MLPKSILITGGAGFVGANLAFRFKQHAPQCRIVAFDNLHRRGSEMDLATFARLGIEFVHGDIREQADLAALSGNFDLFIEASAEPSVLAGVTGSPDYVLHTNLSGTLNCLEFARARAGMFLFLSTSRVYSMEPLKNLSLVETSSRFELREEQTQPGVSKAGIGESFPTHLARSFYGATKLASEMVIQEYADTYGLKALVNRCGVICGPGQFGKIEQGVFSLWVLNHYFGRPLKYTGFGGTGKQVRDLLHPSDLFELIRKQVASEKLWNGSPFNVGGGREFSTSLNELTAICRELVGREVPVHSEPATARVDIPLYLSDTTLVRKSFHWMPRQTIRQMVSDIVSWVKQNETFLSRLYDTGTSPKKAA